MVPTQMDYIQIISNASLMVKFVLLLLLFFSVMSWSIIIIKIRYIRKAFKESDIFIDYFWKSRDLASAFTKAKQLSGSPVARIFRIGYAELRKLSTGSKSGSEPAVDENGPSLRQGFSGTDNVKRALRRAINTEMTRISQMVPFLATTGNTTPFIGLFGTVIGIMISFMQINAAGSAGMDVVSQGISEALIATAIGLMAAIPAVIAYNYFLRRIRVLSSEMENFSSDFLNIVKRHFLK